MYNFKESFNNKLNEKLDLLIDFNSHKEIINQIKFEGDLINDFAFEIQQLETLVQNIKLNDFFETLQNHFKKSDSHFLSLPLHLIYKWLKDIHGLYLIKENTPYLCLCKGVTKDDLENEIANLGLNSYGEIIANTKATLSCGKCTLHFKKNFYQVCSKEFKKTFDSQFFDESGKLIEFLHLSPAKFLIKIDDLIKEWVKQVGYLENSIIIKKAEGQKLYVEIDSNVKKLNQSVISELEEFLFLKTGLLIFLFDEF